MNVSNRNYLINIIVSLPRETLAASVERLISYHHYSRLRSHLVPGSRYWYCTRIGYWWHHHHHPDTRHPTPEETLFNKLIATLSCCSVLSNSGTWEMDSTTGRNVTLSWRPIWQRLQSILYTTNRKTAKCQQHRLKNNTKNTVFIVKYAVLSRI